MIFEPQRYRIEDRPGEPFISGEEIEEILAGARNPAPEQVREVVAHSMARERLSMARTAVLLNATDDASRQLIFEAARQLKKEVYGERIVIFAPLYIGNRCMNDCSYCGFRAGNRAALRRTLSAAEIAGEVRELEATGQRRLILVYGEHPDYSAEFIADTVHTVYATRRGGEGINRVNINAAPFDVEGFRTIKQAGIGTYQIFQESYDRQTYARFHSSGRKRDFDWRLTALDRAMEAGIDDVGLGVLFGLGDWRGEVMGLVRHTNHLEACFGVGPHTISFPRIQNASALRRDMLSPVSDSDFMFLVAVLRLAVPYAGLILTAREPRELRDTLIDFGVSQIDAGTNLEIGGYAVRQDGTDVQHLEKEQFELSDTRSLAVMVDQLVDRGHIPSFCTACYRAGRTGEHFMEFSTRGFIKRFCTPNALVTFAEWLEEHATPGLKECGWRLIGEKLAAIDDPALHTRTAGMLDAVRRGERDRFI